MATIANPKLVLIALDVVRCAPLRLGKYCIDGQGLLENAKIYLAVNTADHIRLMLHGARYYDSVDAFDLTSPARQQEFEVVPIKRPGSDDIYGPITLFHQITARGKVGVHIEQVLSSPWCSFEPKLEVMFGIEDQCLTLRELIARCEAQLQKGVHPIVEHDGESCFKKSVGTLRKTW